MGQVPYETDTIEGRKRIRHHHDVQTHKQKEDGHHRAGGDQLMNEEQKKARQLTYSKKYYAKHKQEVSERSRRWKIKNRERYNALDRERRKKQVNIRMRHFKPYDIIANRKYRRERARVLSQLANCRSDLQRCMTPEELLKSIGYYTDTEGMKWMR